MLGLLLQGYRDIFRGLVITLKFFGKLVLVTPILISRGTLESGKVCWSIIFWLWGLLGKVKKTPKPTLKVVKPRVSALRRRLVWPWMVLGCLLLITISVYSLMLIKFFEDLPAPESLGQLRTPSTSEFYDRNGKLLYRLYEGRDRTIVSLDNLPADLVNATVAIEDKHFFNHKGIDLEGIARSAMVYVRDHQIQGGSTITQQLIKNTLLTPDRTWSRKAKEIVLALWAETIYSKQQILEMYFNESPYGGPAWGIEAAAQTYFNKHSGDLNLAESAYLAGLPASPSVYSPFGQTAARGIDRQKEVLGRMLGLGFISQNQYDGALKTQLKFVEPTAAIKAPHFVMYLKSVLSQKYTQTLVTQGGLKITTTLDLDVQEVSEKILTEELAKIASLNVTNGAVMVMDPRNGQILAMVGSKNYYDSKIGNFNVATAPRQPGSSIKPITYATAFKQGYSPGNILLDRPTSFSNQWEKYNPVNYDGRWHGPVTIRTALGSSYNIPAVKMLAMVGIPNMIATAKDLGITTFDETNRFGLSLTLGGGEVKLIDMMAAYSTFANQGIHHSPQGVLKMVDSYGTILEDNSNDEGSKAIEPAVAYLINNILADNNARAPAFGPNSLLKIPGYTVAVKTGTTDLKRDNWTFGYTPAQVVGVWVGNNDNTPMNPQLSSGVTGAAPIWNRIMTTVLKNHQEVAFLKPLEVVERVVDGRKDLTITGIPKRTTVAFGRRKEKAGEVEKEVITFTDSFSRSNLGPIDTANIP